MGYGPRRPDWQRVGLAPSRLEMSRMKFHRHGVLAGWPSLLTAGGHVWVRRWDALAADVSDLLLVAKQFLRKHLGMTLKRPKELSNQSGDPPKVPSAIDAYESFKPLPRTPGMDKDDPMVISGRYR